MLSLITMQNHKVSGLRQLQKWTSQPSLLYRMQHHLHTSFTWFPLIYTETTFYYVQDFLIFSQLKQSKCQIIIQPGLKKNNNIFSVFLYLYLNYSHQCSCRCTHFIRNAAQLSHRIPLVDFQVGLPIWKLKTLPYLKHQCFAHYISLLVVPNKNLSDLVLGI